MSTKQKLVIAAAGAIIAIGSAGAAIYFRYFNAPEPKQMDAQQIMEFVKSQDFNSMPREKRREFFGRIMDQRVNGYFTLPEEQRMEYLDKIIDEMSEMRQQFRRFEEDPNRPRPDPNQWRQRRNNMTAEQRRAFRETRDPKQDAMRRAFFEALRNRAQERGIQMGPGPGGRREP